MERPVILVVEDENIIQAVIEDALVDAGFTVLLAGNGPGAMNALESDAQPDAIVTDIRLGGAISGWDIARHARELSPNIGVVYISADSGVEWHSHGVPGSLFIQKPFAEAQIVTGVSTVINNASSTPVS
ncbi:response regulator [Rhizorhabdus argentea]|uniref:response regulator n=1 Tax=Rhizorhabdus argentea TaxID=1387174 RepID=UPI0030EF8CEE